VLELAAPEMLTRVVVALGLDSSQPGIHGTPGGRRRPAARPD
jgi:hypothetical protein